MKHIHILFGVLALAFCSRPTAFSDYVPQVVYIVSCDGPCSDYEEPDVFKFDASLLDGEHNELKLAERSVLQIEVRN